MLVRLRGINSNFINQFPKGSFSMAITRRKVHLFRIILLISLTLISLLERSVTGDQSLDSTLVLHCSTDPIGSAVWQQRSGFWWQGRNQSGPLYLQRDAQLIATLIFVLFLASRKIWNYGIAMNISDFWLVTVIAAILLAWVRWIFWEGLWKHLALRTKFRQWETQAGEEKGYGDLTPGRDAERTFSLNSGTLERFS